ncbi:MAG TPA: S8 family serine peptidase [Fimbriimonas sp.]
MHAKSLRTPLQRKIDSSLLDAARMWRGEPISPSVPRLHSTVRPDAAGRVVVDLHAEVSAFLLAQIEIAGGVVLSAYPEYQAVRAVVPLDRLEAVAGMHGVRFVEKEQRAVTNTGSVTSEGDVAHRSFIVRNNYGLTGTGVPIGVLSDGADNLALSQQSGDLPNVYVLAKGAGAGQEGRAMLEIVHDLAPGSPLRFATAFGGQANFATNIRRLANIGCKVIIDDVIYFGEPAFQDGIIAQAVEYANEAGALYFSSAGNSGRLSAGTSGVWQGNFSSGGSAGSMGVYHKFGSFLRNRISNGPSSFPMMLQWSDPWGNSTNDYDLYMLDADGNVVAKSDTLQAGLQNPFESVDALNGHDAVVVKYSGQARYLRLTPYSAELMFRTNGQTWGHMAANRAFGIAALSAQDKTGSFTSDDPLELFSSDGPRKIFFNADGTEVTPGNLLASGGILRRTPDFAAADGVRTSVSGFTRFYGTSAASPHAGAIAALLRQHQPNHTYDSLKSLLAATTIDSGTTGYDIDSGWGVIMADRAIRKQVYDSIGALTLAATEVSSGYGTLAKIDVSVPAPPKGLVFRLSTDLSSAIEMPAEVKILGGKTSATFIIQTKGAGNTTATISARLGLFGPVRSAKLKIGPIVVHSVAASPSSLYGGRTSVGTVTLSSEAPGDVAYRVPLTSADEAVAEVPATVSVPAGSRSATFSIQTHPVSARTSVAIGAAFNGIEKSTTVNVLSPIVAGMTLSPTTVKGGSASIGKVSLVSPAPAGGFTVSLKSSNEDVATVPATVLVPAGATSIGFEVRTQRVAATTSVTISATPAGRLPVSKSLSVTP